MADISALLFIEVDSIFLILNAFKKFRNLTASLFHSPPTTPFLNSVFPFDSDYSVIIKSLREPGWP